MKVTSYSPRAHAVTSAFTVLVAVETTSSSVPSPAPAASTLNVSGTPNEAIVVRGSNPAIDTRETSNTLQENGDPLMC
uniref:Putative secreted protein n=1 Tax=Anopheles darlingi TaxID=43151 RepID=A0A2M4D7P6_ANODA